MNSDFLYSELADRDTFAVWQDNGTRYMLNRAKEETHRMLAAERLKSLDKTVDKAIRSHHDIQL